MRVLVTGSRDWEDWHTIARALNEVWWVATPDEPIIIVHGDCPTGADSIADDYARYMKWEIERYPADWERFGRKAGIRRNIKMVRLGADVCLAFIKNHSPGATHCSDAAERAGIPTRRYYA